MAERDIARVTSTKSFFFLKVGTSCLPLLPNPDSYGMSPRLSQYAHVPAGQDQVPYSFCTATVVNSANDIDLLSLKCFIKRFISRMTTCIEEPLTTGLLGSEPRLKKGFGRIKELVKTAIYTICHEAILA